MRHDRMHGRHCSYLDHMRGLMVTAAAVVVLLATWPVLCVQGEYDEDSCTSACFISLPWTAEDTDRWAVFTSLPAAIVEGKNLEIFSPSIGMPLLARGLIDEVDLHVLPRLLGDGTRLYDVADGSRRKLQNLGRR
jgi:hypothetical protein